MKLDLGSFAFGSSVATGGGTPSWGTALGQGKGLKFTYPGWENIMSGILYKSVPTSKIFMPIGKGGHVYNGLEDEGIQFAAVFDIVYINEVRVNAPFILVVYRDSSESWDGRRTLKYSDKIEYHESDSRIVRNCDFIPEARKALQIEENACWLVSDIYIEDQDTLHLFAGIIDAHTSKTFASSSERKAAWLNSIKNTLAESSVYKQYLEGLPTTTNYLNDMNNNLPLQQIFYGAPGTGKSHTVKSVTGTLPKENVFRTTFHPDTDYSTFVGCYKPTKINKEPIYTEGVLISKLTEIKNSGVTYPCQKFGAKYWESLKQLSSDAIKNILTACGFTENMSTEVSKGMAVGEDLAPKNSTLTYQFVPQAFLKAYVRAYLTKEPVFLVIEEINRGNCAQIFGDLFQLLDRNAEGKSDYPIKADTDLCQYLKETYGEDFAGITDDELCLPNNLYIWATMNTSDQSLFPIDSAFKRRWDWKYVPIKYGKKDWKIEIGDKKYSWVDFQKVINKRIFEATESEDKQLGDYFVIADGNNIVSADLLLNKVIFYLWNDVCKDGDGDIFTINTDLNYSSELDASKNESITFSEFFQERDTKLQQWMRYLGINPVENNADEEQDEEIGSYAPDTKEVHFSRPEYAPILSPLKELWGEESWYGKNGNGGNIVCQSLHLQVAGNTQKRSICVALDNRKNNQAEVKLWFEDNKDIPQLKNLGIDTFMRQFCEGTNYQFRDFTDNKVHKGWGIVYPSFPFDNPEEGIDWIKNTMEKLKAEIDAKLA